MQDLVHYNRIMTSWTITCSFLAYSWAFIEAAQQKYSLGPSALLEIGAGEIRLD